MGDSHDTGELTAGDATRIRCLSANTDGLLTLHWHCFSTSLERGAGEGRGRAMACSEALNAVQLQ